MNKKYPVIPKQYYGIFLSITHGTVSYVVQPVLKITLKVVIALARFVKRRNKRRSTVPTYIVNLRDGIIAYLSGNHGIIRKIIRDIPVIRLHPLLLTVIHRKRDIINSVIRHLRKHLAVN